jgi:hypothetical protein
MSTHEEILKHIQKERKSVSLLYGNSTESVTEQAICRMVWNLFSHKVLEDPTKHYLDYACGKGSILLYGVEVLFVSLKREIKDPWARLEHIIKNQLFGVDISKGQTDIARSALRRMLKDPTALVNIECNDSLTRDFYNMKKKFNLATNVPFQNGKDPNFYKKFRFDLNKKLEDILEYRVIISPNYMTLTSNESNTENLSIYKDLGNAFESITLPAGVCVTREDPAKTKLIEFTDIKGNTTTVSKEDFVVLADSSVFSLIKKIQTEKTLDARYIHDSNKIDNSKETKTGSVFYVDKAGETNKDVKGFFVEPPEGNIREGSFVVFAYNAPGDPLDVGNKKLGPTKVLKNGKYIFSGSVVALKFDTDSEAENCKKLLDCEWSKKIIRAVKYATNNSKSLLSVLPEIDFTNSFKEELILDKFK